MPADAALSSWATPNARDHKGAPTIATHRPDNGKMRADQLDFQAALASGTTTESSDSETGKRGVLNPELTLWLQGFPEEWLNCMDWGILSSHSAAQRSSVRSSKRKPE